MQAESPFPQPPVPLLGSRGDWSSCAFTHLASRQLLGGGRASFSYPCVSRDCEQRESKGSPAARGCEGVYHQKDVFPTPNTLLSVCGQPGPSSLWETLVPGKWRGLSRLLWGPGPQQCLEGCPTGWDAQLPLPVLRHALVAVKLTKRARRQGFAVRQHPQHRSLVGQGSAFGAPSLQEASLCQSSAWGGAGSRLGAAIPRGLATSISSQETLSPLLHHLFGSAAVRPSGDQVPEPACIPKPTGRLGVMTDTNPLPPKFPFHQPRFLFNSL